MLPNPKVLVQRTKLTVDEMVKWSREEFRLPEFRVTYKITGRSDRSWCKGGMVPHIQLGVQSLLAKEVVAFIEYRSFNNYLEVGGFKTDSWELWNDAVIAHEMAHAVHGQLQRQAGIIRKGERKFVEGVGLIDTQPHGTTFLAIYKRLRNRFINDRVPREAYTAPRKNFADPTGDAVDAAFGVAGKPLEGCMVRINSSHYQVMGFDPESRRQYAWKAKCPRTGRIVNLKLVDIAHTPEAHKIIMENSALRAMLEIAQGRQASRRQASATRSMRRRFGW